MTKTTKAEQRAVNKYIKNNYDRINLTMQKGKKEELKAFVEECGYPSMNQFVVDSIEYYKEAVLRDMKNNEEADREIMKKLEGNDCL